MSEMQKQVDVASDTKPEQLQLVYYPDERLYAKSSLILESIPDSAKLQNFIKSMYLTMRANGGVGLSAIQVGVPLRLFVLDIKGVKETVINPSILESSEESFEKEGCLSMPFVSTRVRRPNKIKASFFNERGEKVEKEFTGLWAKAFLHENDHLDGITMYDRIDKLSQATLLKKFKKIKKVLGLRIP